MVRLLALPPGASLVDLGCGRGRHTIPLSLKGFRVTGVDLSDVMLNLARERASRERATVEWVREDMRTFIRPGAFDACLSLFTSFGYFCDEENQGVLTNMARSLKESGVFLLDLRNARKGLSAKILTERSLFPREVCPCAFASTGPPGALGRSPRSCGRTGFASLPPSTSGSTRKRN